MPGGTFSLTAPVRLEHVDPSLKRESLIVPEHTLFVTLPKPIAIAILLATLAFPLRGDGYKEGAPEYRYRACEGRRRVSSRRPKLAHGASCGGPSQEACMHSCSAPAMLSTMVAFLLTTDGQSPRNTSSYGRTQSVNGLLDSLGLQRLTFGEKAAEALLSVNRAAAV